MAYDKGANVKGVLRFKIGMLVGWFILAYLSSHTYLLCFLSFNAWIDSFLKSICLSEAGV